MGLGACSGATTDDLSVREAGRHTTAPGAETYDTLARVDAAWAEMADLDRHSLCLSWSRGQFDQLSEIEGFDQDIADEFMEVECQGAPDGSQEHPWRLDWPLQCEEGRWHVTVVDIEMDAGQTMAEADPLSGHPDDGHQYVLITYELTYFGADDGSDVDDPASPSAALTITVLGRDGDLYSAGSCGTEPNPLLLTGEMYPGASVQAQECYEVRSDHLDGAMLRFGEGDGAAYPELAEMPD